MGGGHVSMFNCPECGEWISAAAITCPYCGFPIKEKPVSDTWLTAIAQNLRDDENAESILALASDEQTNPHLLESIARVSDLRLARRLAQNPSTPSSVLERFVYLDDKELLFMLAKNPHTPSQALIRLYERIDAPADENLRGFAGELRCRPTCGTKAGLRAIKVAIALNKNTPAAILSELAYDEDRFVRAATFGNNKLPSGFLAGNTGRQRWTVGPSGLLNPLIPYKDLVSMRENLVGWFWQVEKNPRMYRWKKGESHGDIVDRYVEAVQGAGFPRLPQESIEAIEDAGVGIPKTIVLNPAVTLDILTKAYGKTHTEAIWTARDPKTPAVVVKTLYRNSCGMVRIAAAANPNLPEEIFAERFGEACGGFPVTSQDYLDDYDDYPYDLLYDEANYSGWGWHFDWGQYWVGVNDTYRDDEMTEELRLLTDADLDAWAGDWYIDEMAEEERVEEELYWTFLENLAFASNPSTPAYALRFLSQCSDDVARVVASNPSAPEDLLRELSHTDACWDAVIMNPSCSIAVLESLEEDRQTRGFGQLGGWASVTPWPVSPPEPTYDEDIPF